MKTIGWGIVQIPIIDHYRMCFCLKRDLPQAASGTGWKMFAQSVIRIVMLTIWGMQHIDFSLPQSKHLMVGIYVEISILALQVADGMLTVFSSWFENMFFLYPVLFVIPFSFLVDVLVKATCYGQLFLWPHVTVFGIFSLVEIWFRYLSLMYCWIAVISFIHYARGKDKPFQKEESYNDSHESLTRATSSTNPFSRSSTLSRRGRRSFLLKAQRKENTQTSGSYEDEKLLRRTKSDSSLSHTSNGHRQSVDLESSTRHSDLITSQFPAKYGDKGNSSCKPLTIPIQNRRKGGFVPDFLRTPSQKLSGQTEQPKEYYSGDVRMQNHHTPSNVPLLTPAVKLKSTKSSSSSKSKESHKASFANSTNLYDYRQQTVFV